MNCPGCAAEMPDTYRGRPIKQAVPCESCICLTCWRVRAPGRSYCYRCLEVQEHDQLTAQVKGRGLRCVMCGRPVGLQAMLVALTLKNPRCQVCGGNLTPALM